MVTAELSEIDREGQKLDYVAYNRILEEQIRAKFEDGDFEIQIIGFAKQIGDIADGASAVLEFCAIALLLTALAVYWYCHSLRFTLLPIACSLTSLVWQFGTLRLLGFGLDPLAVLVPFLVFAIGVSHGVQQINFIVRELAHGKSTDEAARDSFTGLLIPGTLALVTAFVSFITLLLIPIPMVRELAITASLGVAYKIVTNLVMLPVAASLFTFTKDYADKAMLKREERAGWLHVIALVAEPRNAVITVMITAAIFGVSVWQSQRPRGRHASARGAGAASRRTLQPGRGGHLEAYDIGLDWLTVVFEAPPDSDAQRGDRGVRGRVHLEDVDRAGRAVGRLVLEPAAPVQRGVQRGEPEDGGRAHRSRELRRAERRDRAAPGVHEQGLQHDGGAPVPDRPQGGDDQPRHRGRQGVPRHAPPRDVKIRLAAGNAGVLAAINDEVEKSELPMMLYVYAAILVLVFLVYRDLRAMVACCLPLTVGTFIGYWFMKELKIGLTVATLPVMVLAVGIGVDYAFYIYNRLMLHLGQGFSIVAAMEKALAFEAMATIFTAITLAAGVVTWSFSPLKFQADMGKLLAFMFLVNMIMAMTALPALAVVLERIIPRKSPVRVSEILSHPTVE